MGSFDELSDANEDANEENTSKNQTKAWEEQNYVVVVPPKKTIELPLLTSPEIKDLTTITNTIEDYVFVYEFGGNRSSLDDENMVHRWRNAEVVYVVWQGIQQFGAARNLCTPHGQVFVKDVIKALQKMKRPLETKFVFVGADGVVDDENMFVINEKDKIALYSNDEIRKIIKIGEKQKKEEYHRQKTYVDLGFTSLRCSGRRTGFCDMGLVTPRLFAGTKTAESNKIFSKTKYLIEKTKRSKVMKKKKNNEMREQMFGKKINQNNLFEAIRVHETIVVGDEKCICKVHRDVQNSAVFPEVVWWSAMVRTDNEKISRQGVVGYWRSSIDVYYQNREKNMDYLLFCKEKIQQIQPERYHFLGKKMEEQESIVNFEFMSIKKAKCNLSVESYLQPFVCVLSSALAVANPSKKESLRMLAVLGNTLCSGVYSSIAFRIWFTLRNRSAKKLQEIYLQVGTKLKEEKKIPPLRFQKRKDFSKIKLLDDAWEQEFSYFWNEVSRLDGKKKFGKEEYKKLFRACKKIKGIGTLAANHMLGIGSIVGILPLQIFEFVMDGAEEGMEQISKTIPNLPEEETVAENIKYMCETVTKKRINSARSGENVVCKIGRVIAGSDKRFWDVWEARFGTYEVINGKKIVFGDGIECRGPLLKHDGEIWTKNCNFRVLCAKQKNWMYAYM